MTRRLAAVCLCACAYGQALISNVFPRTAANFNLNSGDATLAIVSPVRAAFTHAVLDVSAVSSGGNVRLSVQGLDESAWTPDGVIHYSATATVTGAGWYTFDFGQRVENLPNPAVFVVQCYPYVSQNITVRLYTSWLEGQYPHTIGSYVLWYNGSSWTRRVNVGMHDGAPGLYLLDGNMRVLPFNRQLGWTSSYSTSLYYMARCTATQAVRLTRVGASYYYVSMYLPNAMYIRVKSGAYDVQMTRPVDMLWTLPEPLSVLPGQEVVFIMRWSAGSLASTLLDAGVAAGPFLCQWFQSNDGVSWTTSTYRYAPLVVGDYAFGSYVD